MTLTLSLADVKSLIAYAREQKVDVLEVDSLKFRFHPAAFVDTNKEPSRPKAPATKEAPLGHYDPEAEEIE